MPKYVPGSDAVALGKHRKIDEDMRVIYCHVAQVIENDFYRGVYCDMIHILQIKNNLTMLNENAYCEFCTFRSIKLPYLKIEKFL